MWLDALIFRKIRRTGTAYTVTVPDRIQPSGFALMR